MYERLTGHPNIVKLLGTSPPNANVGGNKDISYLVLEAVTLDGVVGSSTLLTLAQSKPALARSPAEDVFMVTMLLGAARGLGWMHDQGVIFCDVKLENVLVDAASSTAKWCDFGHCNEGPTFRRTGTPGFWAPEQIVRQAITRRFLISPATDVWCFGVMMLEVFSSRDLDEYPTALQTIVKTVSTDAAHVCNSNSGSDALRLECGRKMRSFFLGYHHGTPVEFLAQKCLEPEPAARPSMKEVATLLGDFLLSAKAIAME
jgi:serine/threonine protein kinase